MKSARLDEHRDALLAIKSDQHPGPRSTLGASTKLPERSDYGWANEFLIRARQGMVRS